MRREAIQSFLDSAFRNRDALEKLAAGLRSAREGRRVDIERTVAKLPSGMQGQARAKLLRGVDMETFREVEPKYLELRRELDTHRGALQKAQAFWRNSAAIVDMATVASPARAAISQNTASAGPVVLKRLAEQALTEKNIDLAGALIARLENMMPSERPFPLDKFAADMEPDYAKDAREKLRLAELNILHGSTALDEMRKGPTIDKLSRAIRQRQLGHKEGDPEPARPAPTKQERAPTPRERILAGLTEREALIAGGKA